MQRNTNKTALIYTRVSSAQQEADGTGHMSQAQRCAKWADELGYTVDMVFHDTYSGGGDFMKRPKMRELLQYIDKNKHKNFVVIFDDLKRFARDTEFHIKLRMEFKMRRVELKCLNYNFEDTPEGEFVETVLAAQNQLDREQNRRQVVQKQKARLEGGYWAFHANIGYTMEKVKGHGKLSIPNEVGKYIREGAEGFANYKFQYLVDVARFWQDKGVFGKQSPEKYIDTVKSILQNRFYIGIIDYPKWDILDVKGQHKPLYSVATYERILRRLDKPKHQRRERKVENPEFELRRLVKCADCGHLMTATFSGGRSKKYPLYSCIKKGCAKYKKSVPREAVHQNFHTILKDLTITVIEANEIACVFDKAWSSVVNSRGEVVSKNAKQMEENRRKIDKYMENLANTENPAMITSYEEKIAELHLENQKLSQTGKELLDMGIPYRTAFVQMVDLIKSPYKLWVSTPFEQKKMVFDFIFDDFLEYEIGKGYRTAKPSILLGFLGEIEKSSVDVEILGQLTKKMGAILEWLSMWWHRLGETDNYK